MSELKITQQILEDSHELLLHVEVPQDRIEPRLRQLAKKYGRKMRIPGFRPGKAPIQLIIARLGRKALVQEIAKDIVNEIYQEAVDMVDREDALFSLGYLRDMELEPLIYEFAVPLQPQVTLGDYRHTGIQAEPVDEADVLRLVDQGLQELRDRNKVWRPVERPVQYGDLVTLSMSMEMETEGGKESVLDEKEWEFMPNESNPTLSPEFDASIVGMEPGEEKTFTITFPEGIGQWSGKTATFHVKVLGVKTQELPELTDDLVAENTEFETVEDLKDAIAANVRAVTLRENEEKALVELFEKLRGEATFRYSPAILTQGIETLAKEREKIYYTYGIESTEQLLKLQGKSWDEYQEELKPHARERLENELILEAIGEAEQFPVSDAEMEQTIRDSDLEEETKQELLQSLKEKPAYRDHVRKVVLRRKALRFLKALLRGKEVPEPGQHEIASEEGSQDDTESVSDPLSAISDQ